METKTITDNKAVYEEFKFFKNLYTTLNKSQFIIFSKNDEASIDMDFLNDPIDTFYILRGKLEPTTEFLKWVYNNNNICMIPLSLLKTIKETLKKNAISISYNETEFIFKTVDSELMIRTVEGLRQKVIKGKELTSVIESKGKKEDFDIAILDNDIVEIFRQNDGTLTTKRTSEKVLEIPSKKFFLT